ncbi:MAG: Asp-tRNA(Asn)/Glu-tRNA(Gln) amidotransferase subunit GatC [Candidatus Paceibacterota bacterium]
MTNEDIQKLGELAKIEIKPEEAEGFKKDFESILGYINQIESVDVSDVKETFSTKNVLQEDVAKNKTGEFSEDLLSSAPNTENGFIKVKKIL